MSELSFQCPACGAGRYRRKLRLRDLVSRTTDETFTLVSCAGCGLLRLHPPPSPEILDAAYPQDYAPFHRRGLAGRIKQYLDYRSVGQMWDYIQPPRRILDLGCATGELLVSIRQRGNGDLVGVEPDEYAAEVARREGFEVRTGYLEEFDFAAGSFSTVLLQHVLEHVPRPDETLREIHRILAPGGAVVVWLPNADSWAATILRRYWLGYDAPRHLTTNSVATLEDQLRRQGFRIVRVDHEWTGMEWAWGLRLFICGRLPGLEPLVARLHTPLMVASTPLGMLAALRRKSGRIVVAAIRADRVTSNPE